MQKVTDILFLEEVINKPNLLNYYPLLPKMFLKLYEKYQ
jgi:hypothetical protein